MLKWIILISAIIGLGFLSFKRDHDRLVADVDMFLETGQIPEELRLRLQNISSTKSDSPMKQSDKSIHTAAKVGGTKLKILYIITSLAEYNTGKRSTEKGSDRLQETLIPVMREGVLSMLDFGYMVDVFIVCHWEVKPERLQLIRQALPPQVGLDFWDDATPLGYKLEAGDLKHIQVITRSLARQHRFVIKDKFFDYDFFACFEDDMLVNGFLVSHNLMVSKELARLENQAPEYPTDYDLNKTSRNDLDRKFYGQLTKKQLRRMLPGLIRVEVLLDEEHYPTQKSTGPIPVDLQFGNVSSEILPDYCCRVRPETASSKMPMRPNASKLFLWETSILALGIRKMPEDSTLDWVVFQRGPSSLEVDEAIGDYWSGRNKEFGKDRRPGSVQGRYVNNMGGWMGSRQQIWNWHTNICPGGFLPPYDAPHYNLDGKDLRNVEYWSGGLHLFTRQHACNMQRVITLDPDGFSKHLIYHTANNKQRQLTAKRENSFSKANTLLGQLNSVRKKAEIEFQKSRTNLKIVHKDS